jgi:hypothetical protein
MLLQEHQYRSYRSSKIDIMAVRMPLLAWKSRVLIPSRTGDGGTGGTKLWSRLDR